MHDTYARKSLARKSLISLQTRRTITWSRDASAVCSLASSLRPVVGSARGTDTSAGSGEYGPPHRRLPVVAQREALSVHHAPGRRNDHVHGRYALAVDDGNAYLEAGLAGLGLLCGPFRVSLQDVILKRHRHIAPLPSRCPGRKTGKTPRTHPNSCADVSSYCIRFASRVITPERVCLEFFVFTYINRPPQLMSVLRSRRLTLRVCGYPRGASSGIRCSRPGRLGRRSAHGQMCLPA